VAPLAPSSIWTNVSAPAIDLCADGANHPAAGLSAAIVVCVEKPRPDGGAADRVTFGSVYSRSLKMRAEARG
jgi:hypothetical protein